MQTYKSTSQSSKSNHAANTRLKQLQDQVDEILDITRTNVEKVLERDQKLSELNNRADALQQAASQFKVAATELRKKNQRQNQVDEVVGTVYPHRLLGTYITMVLQREIQKLSELDDRTDALQQGPSQFKVHATKLKRKYRKNKKIVGGVGAITLIVIIGKSFV